MADFAFYWSQYSEESGSHHRPITGWYTSREWLVKRMSKGDRLWLFIGGDACGSSKAAHRAHLAELMIVKRWQHNPDYDPDAGNNARFEIVGAEDQYELVAPPLLVDRIIRKPGIDATLHIGIARQTPFELDDGQVTELLTLLRRERTQVYALATQE